MLIVCEREFMCLKVCVCVCVTDAILYVLPLLLVSFCVSYSMVCNLSPSPLSQPIHVLLCYQFVVSGATHK